MQIIRHLPELLRHIWFNLYFYNELFIPDFRDMRCEFGAVILLFRLSLHRGHRLVLTSDPEDYMRKWKEYHHWDEEKAKENCKKRFKKLEEQRYSKSAP